MFPNSFPLSNLGLFRCARAYLRRDDALENAEREVINVGRKAGNHPGSAHLSSVIRRQGGADGTRVTLPGAVVAATVFREP